MFRRRDGPSTNWLLQCGWWLVADNRGKLDIHPSELHSREEQSSRAAVSEEE